MFIINNKANKLPGVNTIYSETQISETNELINTVTTTLLGERGSWREGMGQIILGDEIALELWWNG